ncbi:MAG: macro domain-containing protein [Chloroflexi bacterium]|nr:macro domain-containing protein [Chloroflexota bacterium]
MTKVKINKVTIRLLNADLLTVPADGIVTPTDPNLTMEFELARRVGAEVPRELSIMGWCDVGSAIVTSAGRLPFKKILHAVGPRWGEGSERGKLANVTRECLRLAEEHGLHSLVMPAISTGSLGYPVENCALTMLTQIVDYTFEDLRALRSVLLCLQDPHSLEAFSLELDRQVEQLRQSNEGHVQV